MKSKNKEKTIKLQKIGDTTSLPNTSKKTTVYYFDTENEGLSVLTQKDAGVCIGEAGTITIWQNDKQQYQGRLSKDKKIIHEIKSINSQDFKIWLGIVIQICEGNKELLKKL